MHPTPGPEVGGILIASPVLVSGMKLVFPQCIQRRHIEVLYRIVLCPRCTAPLHLSQGHPYHTTYPQPILVSGLTAANDAVNVVGRVGCGVCISIGVGSAIVAEGIRGPALLAGLVMKPGIVQEWAHKRVRVQYFLPSLIPSSCSGRTGLWTSATGRWWCS